MKKIIVIFWILILTACSNEKENIQVDLNNLGFELDRDFEVLKQETFGDFSEYHRLFDILISEFDAERIKNKIKNHSTYQNIELNYIKQDSEVTEQASRVESLYIFTVKATNSDTKVINQVWIDTVTNKLHYIYSDE